MIGIPPEWTAEHDRAVEAYVGEQAALTADDAYRRGWDEAVALVAAMYPQVCSACLGTGTCTTCRGGGINEPGLSCPECVASHVCQQCPKEVTRDE